MSELLVLLAAFLGGTVPTFANSPRTLKWAFLVVALALLLFIGLAVADIEGRTLYPMALIGGAAASSFTLVMQRRQLSRTASPDDTQP